MNRSLLELLPYKHLFDAADEGKVLQVNENGKWRDIAPGFIRFYRAPSEYRVRPEAKTVDVHVAVDYSGKFILTHNGDAIGAPNVRYHFDPDTNKLIDVELIK